MEYGYYNGEFAKSEELKIPLSDRSIFFGDGVYDVAIGHEGSVFQLDEHINRLLSNARRLGMPKLPDSLKLNALITDTVRRANLNNSLVYFQLSRNHSLRVHSAEECERTNILITVSPFVFREKCENLKLILREDMRYRYCDIKTVNLLPAVIASSEAERLGADECIFVRNGKITECAHSNIAIVKDSVLLTHPEGDSILPGITRRHMLMYAKNLGINIKETPFSKHDLLSADEVFITSTTKGLRRAAFIDEAPVGGKDGDVFRALSAAFRDEYVSFCTSSQKI